MVPNVCSLFYAIILIVESFKTFINGDTSTVIEAVIPISLLTLFKCRKSKFISEYINVIHALSRVCIEINDI